jgi:hypothetical protein
VDGTPIDNETGNSLNAETGRGGVDFGNAAMDINPSSIASVSLLKGAFFDPSSKINGVYKGGPYGTSTPFNDNSHISQILYAPDFRGVLIDFAEMSFILAEAANRGFGVGDTAAKHYENGITASMNEWGVDTADVTAYLANADVAFATAAGTDKEKIAKQFWIAMYNRGFEGWTVYRLFDAPTLQ